MKKAIGFIVVLAVLLALGIALGPLYTSRIVDRQMMATVATVDRQGLFAAEYTPGAHGWFSQEDTFTLTPVDPRLRKNLEGSGAETIVLHMHVAYGPLAFSAWRRDGVSLMPVGAVVDTRVEGLGALLRKAGSHYRIHDVVPITGGDTFTLHVTPVTAKEPDGSQVHWSATDLVLSQRGHRVTGHGQSSELTFIGPSTGAGEQSPHMRIAPVTLDIDHLDFVDGQGIGRMTLSWPGLQAIDQTNEHRPAVGVNIGSMRMDVDTHLAEGIAAGHVDLTLAGMSINRLAAGGQKLFDFQNVSISSTTADPQNEYTNSTLVWRVDRIDVGPQTYTPVRLALEMDHQYVPAVLELVRVLAADRRQMQPLPGEPPQFVMKRILGLIAPSVQNLLAHHPVLRLTELQVGLPQGAVSGHGQASLEPANGGTPTLATLPEDLVANLSLQAPMSLVQQLTALLLARQGMPPDQIAANTQRYLTTLQVQGLLRQAGSDYAMDVDYRNGAMTVNGHPFQPH